MAGTVRQRVQKVLLGLYRRLPLTGRLMVVRTLTPSFHVGALCVIERADGALLLLRQSYRRKEAWGFPGGLLKRGEEPADAVRREIREELGVQVEVDDAPMVVVDARHRRVDVIYRGRLAGDDPDPPPPAPRRPRSWRSGGSIRRPCRSSSRRPPPPWWSWPGPPARQPRAASPPRP